MRLFHAVAGGNLALVKRLVRLGADINARDYTASSSIHIAAARNYDEIVLYMIELGADIDCMDKFGNTPMDVAMAKGHCSMAGILQKAGTRRSRSTAENIMKRNFPADVASAMMQSGSVAPTTKQSVSVFFSDIYNYAALRGSLEPLVMVDLLDRLFSKLDVLARHHSVERIDAIDGCYIAAANFSTPHSDHALRLARFAVDAVSAASATLIDERRPELGTVRLLAGLHCGAVCGSMLGSHGGLKYTLVGDAVNVASRMESHGAAGAVQCSGAFGAAVGAQGRGSEELVLVAREGGVAVKGRGHMEAWWLERAAKRHPEAEDLCPAGPARCGS